jgi:hypothetical protein
MRRRTAAATMLVTLGTGMGIATGMVAAQAQAATTIHFAPGATSGTVSGQLATGAEQDYTFSAQGGQLAEVSFSHSSPTERWVLIDPEGSPLHNGMSDQQDQVQVRLTTTGTYRLDVQTTDPGSYTLRLTLPVPIRFAPGATSGTVSGHLPAGGTRNYTFDARAGQTATVHVARTSPTERWVLVAPDGSPLHNGMTEQQDQVTVPLPDTGTYLLDVQTTDSGDYTLRLSIPGS